MTDKEVLDLAHKHLLYYKNEDEKGEWFGDNQDVLEFARAIETQSVSEGYSKGYREGYDEGVYQESYNNTLRDLDILGIDV